MGVLSAAVCAVAAGAQSYVAIAEWVADLPEQVAAALGLTEKCPCESTIRRVVQRLDGDRFDAVISAWITQQLHATRPPVRPRRAVAVDGKTLRGTRNDDSPPRHLLAVIDHQARVVLGQINVTGTKERAQGKAGEIAAFAPLLDTLDLNDVVVTTDALHTQRNHVDYLHQRGAHWVLTVEGNQPRGGWGQPMRCPRSPRPAMRRQRHQRAPSVVVSPRPGEPTSGRWTGDHGLPTASPVQAAVVSPCRIAQRPAFVSERPDRVDPPRRPVAGRARGNVGGVLHVAAQVEGTTGPAVELVEGHGVSCRW
jgi:DDE family transposase